MDRALWGFGQNRDGQLISKQADVFPSPHPLPGSALKVRGGLSRVACGRNFSVLLSYGGEVRACGGNSSGQLGVGTAPLGEATSDRPDGQVHGCNTGRADSTAIPMQVMPGVTVSHVACGAFHTLALTVTGDVYGFGSNVHGELGLGNGELGRGLRCRHQTEPRHIQGLDGKGVVDLACGDYSSFAVTHQGEFWSWGENTMGQLGLGHTKNTDTPQVCPWIPKEEVMKVAAGAYHTLLLCAHERVLSFGQNDKGVLGNGQRGGPECWTTPQLLEPLLGKGIVDIQCGTMHGVALGKSAKTNHSRVFTWGWNCHGQLGLAGMAQGDVCIGGKAVEGLMHKDVVCIAAGAYHTIAVTSDNQVYVWGDNRFGQLGVDSMTTHAVGTDIIKCPQPVMVPKEVPYKWSELIPSDPEPHDDEPGGGEGGGREDGDRGSEEAAAVGMGGRLPHLCWEHQGQRQRAARLGCGRRRSLGCLPLHV